MSKPIFCFLAFGSTAINNYGQHIPCCNIDTAYFNFTETTKEMTFTDRINSVGLREVRRELMNGNWPLTCRQCKDAENKNVQSMRTIWNKKLEVYNIPIVEYINPNEVRYLDLTFGTKCNSKCMTCGPFNSDQWEEEHEIIWGDRQDKAYEKNIKRIAIDCDQAKTLLDEFPNFEHASFIGGEPTISNEHYEFLKMLVKSGRSQSVNLNYVTNLTGVSYELIELWKYFKRVHVSVSIDGYGAVNEYIRYPFKWSKIDASVHEYMKQVQIANETRHGQFSIGLSCTVSIFNILDVADLLEYWFETANSFPIWGGTLASNVGVSINRVIIPDELNLNMMPIEYRQQGSEKLLKLKNKIDSYNNESDHYRSTNGFVDSINLLLHWFEEPQNKSEKLLNDMIFFIEKSDKFRNRHIKDYIPELYNNISITYTNS